MSESLALFADVAPVPLLQGFLDILPVSVIDIAAQGKRKGEDHGSTSSRANYSPFPQEVAVLCAQFYLRDCKRVFDPFAGWGERHAACKSAGLDYLGYDTSPAAIAKAAAEYGVQNVLADSASAPIPQFDGLLTCPPYWNLELYESEDGIDRCKTFALFLHDLKHIFYRSYMQADRGATFCVMVGDWRSKHVYYDLEFHVSAMFKDFGADVVDKVVVSRSKVSKIKIMLPQAKRLGYTVRVHENLLVFRKP